MQLSIGKEEIEAIRAEASAAVPGEQEWRASCLREFRGGGGGMELYNLAEKANVFQMVRCYLNIVDARRMEDEPELKVFREDVFDSWLTSLAIPCSADDLFREMVSVYCGNKGVSAGLRSFAAYSMGMVGKVLFSGMNEDGRWEAIIQTGRGINRSLPDELEMCVPHDLMALESYCHWFFEARNECPRGILMAHNLHLYCKES